MKKKKRENDIKKILKLLEGQYTLCIERTSNGVILRYHNSYQFDCEKYTESFNFGNDDDYNAEEFQKFINSVIAEFQPETKWKEKRVSTYIAHGNKYDCKKMDCPICLAEAAVLKEQGIDFTLE